jgi:hypothetical protein
VPEPIDYVAVLADIERKIVQLRALAHYIREIIAMSGNEKRGAQPGEDKSPTPRCDGAAKGGFAQGFQRKRAAKGQEPR